LRFKVLSPEVSQYGLADNFPAVCSTIRNVEDKVSLTKRRGTLPPAVRFAVLVQQVMLRGFCIFDFSWDLSRARPVPLMSLDNVDVT
jgi:hypothetical protein